MITHLVLMDLHRSDDKDYVAQQVHSLAGRVPGLEEVRGGPSVVQLRTTWSLGFVMSFQDAASLQVYQTHPAHLEVAANITEKISQMATCDLEEF